jgi:uncharacterized membrane protein
LASDVVIQKEQIAMDRATANVLAVIGMIGVILAVFMPFPLNMIALLICGALALFGGLYGSRVYGAIAGLLLGLQALVSPVTALAIGASFAPSADAAAALGLLLLAGAGAAILIASIWAPLEKRPA